MPRPFCPRKISGTPQATYFKPAGIPMRELEETNLAPDEWEAIRLSDLEGLYRKDAADKMGIARQTFDRIIRRARQKVADALIHGKSLRLDPPDNTGGNTASPDSE